MVVHGVDVSGEEGGGGGGQHRMAEVREEGILEGVEPFTVVVLEWPNSLLLLKSKNT